MAQATAVTPLDHLVKVLKLGEPSAYRNHTYINGESMYFPNQSTPPENRPPSRICPVTTSIAALRAMSYTAFRAAGPIAVMSAVITVRLSRMNMTSRQPISRRK